MLTKDRWKKAQEKEYTSWLDTDMTYEYLINNWLSRSQDFKFITDKINKNSAILDVGSGPVSVLHVFPKCKTMIAVDPLESEYQRKYQRLDYIKYISDKAEKLTFLDNSFDFILCINTLDHVENYKKVLEEMTRCLKPDGYLYMEYENTSPFSVLLANFGYKKPLLDFHPVLLKNKKVLKFLRKNDCQVLKLDTRPQLTFKKIKSILSILFKKRKVSNYEENISVLNYGISKAIFHYLVILVERTLFCLNPMNFGYFTSLIAKKEKK